MKNSSHHAIAILLMLLIVWLVSSPAAEIHAPRIKIPANFYQVIITNNLFRPLGWSKPRAKPRFELIATVIKPNDRHKALIRNTKTRKVYYVTVSAELRAGVTVENIEPHSVTLKENGKSKVYRLPL